MVRSWMARDPPASCSPVHSDALFCLHATEYCGKVSKGNCLIGRERDAEQKTVTSLMLVPRTHPERRGHVCVPLFTMCEEHPWHAGL